MKGDNVSYENKVIAARLENVISKLESATDCIFEQLENETDDTPRTELLYEINDVIGDCVRALDDQLVRLQ